MNYGIIPEDVLSSVGVGTSVGVGVEEGVTVAVGVIVGVADGPGEAGTIISRMTIWVGADEAGTTCVGSFLA